MTEQGWRLSEEERGALASIAARVMKENTPTGSTTIAPQERSHVERLVELGALRRSDNGRVALTSTSNEFVPHPEENPWSEEDEERP